MLAARGVSLVNRSTGARLATSRAARVVLLALPFRCRPYCSGAGSGVQPKNGRLNRTKSRKGKPLRRLPKRTRQSVKQIEPGRNARSAAHFKEKAHRQKRRWASGEIKSGRLDLNWSVSLGRYLLPLAGVIHLLMIPAPVIPSRPPPAVGAPRRSLSRLPPGCVTMSFSRKETPHAWSFAGIRTEGNLLDAGRCPGT